MKSKGLSRVFSNTTVQSINSLVLSFLIVQLSYPCMTTGKTIALTRQTFVGKVMSLLFDMLSGFIITFLPNPILTISSKLNYIQKIPSPNTVTLGASASAYGFRRGTQFNP